MASTDPGPRDHLITRSLERDLSDLDAEVRDEQHLDPAEAPERLSRHAMGELKRRLDGDEPADAQARRVNEILRQFGGDETTDAEVALPARLLQGIKARSPLGDVVPLPPPPATPFSQSDLLVNAEGQPNVGSELRAELATADSVDLICAFVIWSGVRHLRDALAAVKARGGRIRVITTTYMGATEKRAVDELVALGAEVHVAFDARTTKLHAKAWLLERASGLSTAFVGSSNLSHTALFDGLEWNVRLSSMDAAHVIDRVRSGRRAHTSSGSGYGTAEDWARTRSDCPSSHGSPEGDTGDRSWDARGRPRAATVRSRLGGGPRCRTGARRAATLARGSSDGRRPAHRCKGPR
jgi:HKD family nuclease